MNDRECSKLHFVLFIILHLSRKFIKPKNPKKGIQTTAPNQFLHIDTTYYKKLIAIPKVAVAFASDNFSKYIMGHIITLENSHKNIVKVLRKTIDTIHKFHPNHLCTVNIVSDGGTENKAKPIKELLQKNNRPALKHLIALKDIAFSNSPIEAVNKIYKRYLRFYKPTTYNELISFTALFIHDYNRIRPHGSLKGLTPFQAYTNMQAPDYKQDIQLAQKRRITFNKKKRCLFSC